MHAQLSQACSHPQVGDHCSVWYSRGAGIRQGWYDGKIEEVRTRHKDNVSVWFPDGMDRLRGGYVRIYFKFTILKNYMHHARVARARARSRLARRSVG